MTAQCPKYYNKVKPKCPVGSGQKDALFCLMWQGEAGGMMHKLGLRGWTEVLQGPGREGTFWTEKTAGAKRCEMINSFTWHTHMNLTHIPVNLLGDFRIRFVGWEVTLATVWDGFRAGAQLGDYCNSPGRRWWGVGISMCWTHRRFSFCPGNIPTRWADWGSLPEVTQAVVNLSSTPGDGLRACTPKAKDGFCSLQNSEQLRAEIPFPSRTVQLRVLTLACGRATRGQPSFPWAEGMSQAIRAEAGLFSDSSEHCLCDSTSSCNAAGFTLCELLWQAANRVMNSKHTLQSRRNTFWGLSSEHTLLIRRSWKIPAEIYHQL